VLVILALVFWYWIWGILWGDPGGADAGDREDRLRPRAASRIVCHFIEGCCCGKAQGLS